MRGEKHRDSGVALNLAHQRDDRLLEMRIEANQRLVAVLFLAIVAVAVAEAAQVVGVLLVFSLMVAPAATALRLTSRAGFAVALAVSLALLETWAGIATAYVTNLPPSFWIVCWAAPAICSRCCIAGPATQAGGLRARAPARSIAALLAQRVARPSSGRTRRWGRP